MASANTTAASAPPSWRRYPVGVELNPGDDGSAHARVWAPRRHSVELVCLSSDGDELRATALDAERDGYFSALIRGIGAGTQYKLRLDRSTLVPDPASRFQPAGPHGSSQVVDSRSFRWTDSGWSGVALEDAVIYELHVGTFTPAGTYREAIDRLAHLAEVGVTVIELMPLAEFPGRFGWGYDGVDLFAPYHLYGAPDDLRAFVDAAHAHGLAVLHDVVYNHLGPDGNYLKEFSDHYFKGQTEWGEALNFDGEQSAPVRELVLSNAAYWTDEFHFDGLRLDATQQIFDTSEPHILPEIAARVHALGDEAGRATLVLGENEPQDSRLLSSIEEGGGGLDALWNDDFHHSAMVALTGRDEAYYGGYRGSAQELIASAKYGFLYQGQWFEWQGQRRGTPAFQVAPARFVNFIQNHDQVANAAAGLRAHQLTAPGRYRAITAFLLLTPQTPMLFQGQEFAASAPFLYFADHQPELAKLVRRGRAEFLGQFASIATKEITARLADPMDPNTFARCKLEWSERDVGVHAEAVALVRDLLRLRREDQTLRGVRVIDSDRGAAGALVRETVAGRERNAAGELVRETVAGRERNAAGELGREAVAGRERNAAGGISRHIDGAVLADHALLLRVFGDRPQMDRIIVTNLGRRLHPLPLAEPLAAPPRGMLWRPLWSSEDPRYGGSGMPSVDADDGGWWLPPESTVVLSAVEGDTASRAPGQPHTEREARAAWKALHDAPPR